MRKALLNDDINNANIDMSLLFFNPKENLLPYDGILNDFGVVLDNPNQVFTDLLETLPWQSDIVKIYGKTHITERQVVWMGEDVCYTYSGYKKNSIPWDYNNSTTVIQLKRMVEQKLSEFHIKADFNACLLNFYPNGHCGMSYHADDEIELGNNPIIASLSLGTSRKFSLKHNQTKEHRMMWLESGQLIVMHGTTQTYWKHSIGKSSKITGGRISLTFREISMT